MTNHLLGNESIHGNQNLHPRILRNELTSKKYEPYKPIFVLKLMILRVHLRSIFLSISLK